MRKLLKPIRCPFDFWLSNSTKSQQTPIQDVSFCTVQLSCTSDAFQHLKHHGIIIENEDALVFVLEEYLDYWVRRLSPHHDRLLEYAIEHGFPIIDVASHFSSSSSSTDVKMIKLSGREDEELRVRLNKEKLVQMLAIQEQERTHPPFHNACLFCRSHHPNLTALFDHMYTQHSFQIGLASNLVLVPCFLDLLRDQLKKTRCLFCEVEFRDGMALRRHMRKKKHFRVNPRNTLYDHFYIANYLDPNQVPRSQNQHQDSSASDEDHLEVTCEEDGSADEEGWSDWDEQVDQNTQCLFCSFVAPTPLSLLQTHLPMHHEFDLSLLSTQYKMDVYDRIKLVNFIRRLQYSHACLCGQQFDSESDLNHHYSQNQRHCGLILESREEWSGTQYLLPTYEEDPIFMALDYDEDLDAYENISECADR